MTLDEFKRKHQADTIVYAEDLSPLMEISPDRIREYARIGDFPIKSIQIGSRTKFYKDHVIQYFENREGTKEPRATINLNFTGETLEEVAEKMKQFLQMCRIA